MGDIQSLLKVGFTALAVAQLVILGFRFRGCEAKGELLRFGLFIALVAFRLSGPQGTWFSAPLGGLLLWSAGDYLLTGLRRKGRTVWALGNGVSFAVLLLTTFLGHGETLPFVAFRAFIIALFSVVPLWLLLDLTIKTRVPVHMALFAAGLLAALGYGVDLLVPAAAAGVPDISLWAFFAIVSCLAFMVFQDGYLMKSGLAGAEVRSSRQAVLMRATYARLFQTENALIVQDRLIVSGLLALAAAHDFKNTLSHIGATAEFGLAQADMATKDQSLRLLAEHAETGGKAAVDFLERFSREGRETAVRVSLDQLFAELLRLARASFREQGITFQTRAAREGAEDGLHAFARRGELEQVLLNLLGNAVDSYRDNGGTGPEKTIEIVSSRIDDGVLIEVRDNAGGVPRELEAGLFQVSTTGRGTGLGLFISRSLVERNGGSLTYAPLDGGSSFRLVLPDGNTRGTLVQTEEEER